MNLHEQHQRRPLRIVTFSINYVECKYGNDDKEIKIVEKFSINYVECKQRNRVIISDEDGDFLLTMWNVNQGEESTFYADNGVFY